MGGFSKGSLVALVLAVALALSLSACGGGNDSTSTTPGGTGTGSTETTTPPAAKHGVTASEIENYGREASPADLEEAQAGLKGYFASQAEGKWAKHCDHLSSATAAAIEGLASSGPKFKGKDCSEIFATIQAGVPSSDRASILSGAAVGLRVDGDRGLIIFHGTDGAKHYMQMIEEDGEWKIDAMAPAKFP
jgi:hypothetical protein